MIIEETHMNKEKYEKLISDISNFLENSASQIEPLGFAHNIYNDPCAVEIAIKNKPIPERIGYYPLISKTIPSPSLAGNNGDF